MTIQAISNVSFANQCKIGFGGKSVQKKSIDESYQSNPQSEPKNYKHSALVAALLAMATCASPNCNASNSSSPEPQKIEVTTSKDGKLIAEYDEPTGQMVYIHGSRETRPCKFQAISTDNNSNDAEILNIHSDYVYDGIRYVRDINVKGFYVRNVLDDNGRIIKTEYNVAGGSLTSREKVGQPLNFKYKKTDVSEVSKEFYGRLRKILPNIEPYVENEKQSDIEKAQAEELLKLFGL